MSSDVELEARDVGPASDRHDAALRDALKEELRAAPDADAVPRELRCADRDEEAVDPLEEGRAGHVPSPSAALVEVGPEGVVRRAWRGCEVPAVPVEGASPLVDGADVLALDACDLGEGQVDLQSLTVVSSVWSVCCVRLACVSATSVCVQVLVHDDPGLAPFGHVREVVRVFLGRRGFSQSLEGPEGDDEERAMW